MGLMDYLKTQFLEIIQWQDDSRDTISIPLSVTLICRSVPRRFGSRDVRSKVKDPPGFTNSMQFRIAVGKLKTCSIEPPSKSRSN